MKIIIAPDSYKGTLSARQVAETIDKAVKACIPDAKTLLMPIADGGEGTIDAFGAQKRAVHVTGSQYEQVQSFYGVLGDTAIIELAACAGLPMAKRLAPETATTYGVGQLIRAALDAGFRKFIVALGGSSTNDMGCGMACALGVKFKNKLGNYFIPAGLSLADIESIDISALDPRIMESEIITMCDIDNPLCGEKGASYVFAPQKGAKADMLPRLDAAMLHASEMVKKFIGKDVANIPGAGAAGGCGAGMVAFLSSELRRGIDVVLDTKNFDAELADTDIVFTGEGRFDSQSIDGKAISGIAARTKPLNIPLIVLCGAADESEICYEMGVTAVFSIQRRAMAFKEAKLVNEPSLYKTAYNVMKLISCK
ncbi:MAG: glycerate kinase [Ruminococcaceae bacterium]|nr:glycerate kinase [Oscillospiraceae bacterium]